MYLSKCFTLVILSVVGEVRSRDSSLLAYAMSGLTSPGHNSLNGTRLLALISVEWFRLNFGNKSILSKLGGFMKLGPFSFGMLCLAEQCSVSCSQMGVCL